MTKITVPGHLIRSGDILGTDVRVLISVKSSVRGLTKLDTSIGVLYVRNDHNFEVTRGIE